MAVIGRIRKRVGLLIAFVGISMLLFILGDLVTSNKGIMGRTSDVVGVVSGEKIRYQEFEKKVEQLISNYKDNSKTESIDQNTTEMLREQAWSMAVNDNTLGKEYEKIGVSCGPDELYDMVNGKNPHPQIKQAFTDPKTGIFDPQTVLKFLKNLPNTDEKTQMQWTNFEKAIREERIGQKYKDIIKGGLYVTALEAKNNFLESSRIANLKYVELNFITVPDSSIKPDESELKTYYNAHQNDYKQAETVRKVEYITFDIMPSAADRADVQSWVSKKREEFAQSTNDALFVNQNSDSPFDSTYHAKGTLRPILDTTLFKVPEGTIVGPYEEGNLYKFSKLVNTKMVPDSVKARHILIKIENNDTAKAMSRADSLKSAIKKGAKFADLAGRFSVDQGSAIKGGDLGWFKFGAMVKPFNDACFDGKKGDMPIVRSEFGIHLIEILDKGVQSKQIQVATVERKIEPSQKTYDALYNKANQFAAANNTGELFDSACVKQGLNKRIADNVKENDKGIAGLEQPREMIRWAYKASKGETSKAFTFGDKYVIAHLVDIKEKGFLPLEEVKPQVTAMVKKEKKAEILAEKFSKQAAGATTIDAVAQKLNVAAVDADNVSFVNTFLPAAGSEPKVVGTAFALKQGELSKPIKGDNGVYMIMVKSFTEPPAAKDYEANRKQLVDQRKSRSEYEVFNALKEKANIEDNRGKFY
ncbi:MAG: peptidylprolyl isomerase [Bacteroidetes bacterium]|nr:peptidylprolyl isomerase [Bacteroidota bacterium]